MSRVIVVTGAAKGVGRSVVNQLSKRGDSVVAEDIDPTVQSLAAESVATVVGDVSDPETADRAIECALNRFGRLDGLVNNAGRFISGPIAATQPADWDALFASNVRGAFLHLRRAIPMLREQRGAVVNVASIASLIGIPDQAAYAATKGALAQLTRAAAIELAPHIRVNAVAPGAIDTTFMDSALASAPDVAQARLEIAKSHPLGRYSTADQIAEVIVFLLGADSMTGAIVPVDGGYTAQ